MATEGSRLYLYLINRDYQGLAEIATSGGEPRKLPILTSPNMTPLSLSPDGASLLVIDEHGWPSVGQIWSVPVLGGPPRRVGKAIGHDAAWYPDGKLLTYSNGNEIFLANIDGSESRKLVTMKNQALIQDLVWSPNGSHLRFTTSDGILSTPYFWEISADGTGLHRLFPDWNDSAYPECCGNWTADGKYFVFRSRRQIWALPRKEFPFFRQPKPIQLTSSLLAILGGLPSSDGKKLFVIGKLLRGELVHYDFKAGTFVPFLGGMSAEYVEFSRDGQWMVYVSFPEGTLWRSRADGSERLQLADRAFYPRWSPDGRKIVFVSEYPSKIFEVSAEGGTPNQLMPSEPSQQLDPTWSSDGGKIVFCGNGGNPASSIRVFDLATNQITTLPGSQGLFSPRASPDGKYIAAFSIDSTRLLVFDLKTQQWTEVAKGDFVWPVWSPDGKYLYYVDYSGIAALMRIRMGDHHVEQAADLKDFHTTGRYNVWWAVAPDGSPMALRDVGSTDVYALDWEEP